MSNLVRTTVMLPEDLLQDAKIKAVKEKAHLSSPKDMLAQEWVDLGNIAGSYLASPARMADLGVIYAQARKRSSDNEEQPKPLTAGAIRVKVLTYLNHLHASCSPELQKAYPVNRLTLVKRGSVPYRLKMSEKKGGVAKSVADQLGRRRWKKNVLREHGLEGNDNAYKRSRLREMGLDIPYQVDRPRWRLELEERPLRTASSTDSAVQTALDRLSMGQYRNLAAEDPPLVTTAIKLAQELGYHIPTAVAIRFVDAITAAEIPLSIKETVPKTGPQAGRVQRRFLVWSPHSERIASAFEASAELKQFKAAPTLELICGPARRLPPAHVINKFKERAGFIPITKALRELGVKAKWTKEKLIEYFGQDSPVTLVRAYDTLYCPKNQMPNLALFVESKASSKVLFYHADTDASGIEIKQTGCRPENPS